jgi:hypothetical protein
MIAVAQTLALPLCLELALAGMVSTPSCKKYRSLLFMPVASS